MGADVICEWTRSALHAAVKEGHMGVVRTLLTESQIDAEAFNNKGKGRFELLCC